jgi:hypothetical protein
MGPASTRPYQKRTGNEFYLFIIQLYFTYLFANTCVYILYIYIIPGLILNYSWADPDLPGATCTAEDMSPSATATWVLPSDQPNPHQAHPNHRAALTPNPDPKFTVGS